MNKAIPILLASASLIFFASCKRDSVDDPTPVGPGGYYIQLEGTAAPSLLVVDGPTPHSCQITVRVKDYKGNPLAGKTVVLEQWRALASGAYEKHSAGYFDNDAASISKVTNAAGIITATYYGPTLYTDHVLSYTNDQATIYVKALLSTDDRTYEDSLPQDMISIYLVKRTMDPVVEVVSPHPYEYVSGLVPIKVAAYGDVDICRVYCYLDKILIGKLEGTSLGVEYNFYLNSLLYANDQYKINVEAWDENGKNYESHIYINIEN